MHQGSTGRYMQNCFKRVKIYASVLATIFSKVTCSWTTEVAKISTSVWTSPHLAKITAPTLMAVLLASALTVLPFVWMEEHAVSEVKKDKWMFIRQVYLKVSKVVFSLQNEQLAQILKAVYCIIICCFSLFIIL